MSRYARQIMLPEVGQAGQARLSQSHILVIGAGGLGSPVLQYLAGAGIAEITLLDPDHVEESNLHRQVLFSMEDIGRPKVEAAARHLKARAPEVTLHPHRKPLTADNVLHYLAGVDLVVDAADSFAVSYILSDACMAKQLPLISASVLGQQGYVGGFCGGAPSLRALFPDLPESAANCATAGVMGPMVGVIGALQAQMALKVLLHHHPAPLGQLLQVNMATLSTSAFRFDDAPEPETCWPFVTPAMIPETAQVIELRPEAEAPRPIMARARRILPENLRASDLSRDQEVVLCCASGVRAWRAATLLKGEGFSQIAILAAANLS